MIRLSIQINLIFKMLSDNCYTVLLNTTAWFQGCPINLVVTSFTFSMAFWLTLPPDWNQSNENSQTAHKMSHYYKNTHIISTDIFCQSLDHYSNDSRVWNMLSKWQSHTVQATSAVKFTALSLWSQPTKDTKCYSGINKTFIERGRKVICFILLINVIPKLTILLGVGVW
jgi:hypothetical protein